MDWQRILSEGEERKIREFLRGPFNPREGAQFIQALAEIIQKKPPLSRRLRRFLELTVLKFRKKLYRLTPDQYWELLKQTEESTLPFLLGLFGLAETDQEAISVCRLFLKTTVRYLSSFMDDETLNRPALRLLVMVSGLLAEEWPTWSRFLRAAINNNREADNLLFLWYQFFNQMAIKSLEIIPYSRWLLPLSLSQSFRSIFWREDKNVWVPVPDECSTALTERFSQFYEQISQGEVEKLKFLNWFQENRQWFEHSWDKMWSDIQSNRRYTLRPDGADFIRIGIDALKSADIQLSSIEYLSEEIYPPLVKVRLWWEISGETSTFIWCLGPGKMKNPLGNLLPEGDPREILDTCLAYIAINGYWRIVVREAKRPFDTKPPAGIKPRQLILPKEWVAVRAHFRILPVDWQASEEAKRKSLELFNTPPPVGWTFVIPHQRNIAKIQEGQPLFVYQNEDIGYPA